MGLFIVLAQTGPTHLNESHFFYIYIYIKKKKKKKKKKKNFMGPFGLTQMDQLLGSWIGLTYLSAHLTRKLQPSPSLVTALNEVGDMPSPLCL